MKSRFGFLIFVVAFALSGAQTSRAFDVFPEFHSLMEDEPASLDSTQLIDSEYQSDVLTYLMPLEWDTLFHASQNAYSFTLGSLSNKLFLHHSRLKLSKELQDSLTFRFTFFQQRDLDVNQTHAVLELVRRITPLFSVSVYGEPSMFKRENDLGAALISTPSRDHEIRLFHTWIDVTRQKNNDRPDTFVSGSEPRSIGLVGRCFGCLGSTRDIGSIEPIGSEPDFPLRSERDWIEYFIRWETPTKWKFPNTESEYQYEKKTGGLSARLSSPRVRDLHLNLRLQASEKNESFRPLTAASPVSRSSLDRQIFEAFASAEFPLDTPLIPQAKLEPGLGWFHRHWKGGNDDQLDQRNFLPFVWLRWKTVERAPGAKDAVEIGYEATFFDGHGSQNLASPELRTWVVEHRANFRYVFAFQDNAQLILSITGDIDVALGGTGGLFEGGNGQFRVFF